MRLFVVAIVLIAVIVGVLALTLPHENIIKLIVFRDFFDVSLPILAFGALVKFLFSCPRNRCTNPACQCCQRP